MASRMQQIIEAVRSQFEVLKFRYLDEGAHVLREDSSVSPDAVTNPNDHNTTGEQHEVGWYFGPRSLNSNDRPPKVVWVTPTVDHEAPARVSPQADGAYLTKQVATRAVQTRAYCFGRDYEQTENLVHAVMAAAYNTIQAAFSYQGEQWVTQEPSAQEMRDGEMCIVSMAVEIPVLCEEILAVPLNQQASSQVIL